MSKNSEWKKQKNYIEKQNKDTFYNLSFKAVIQLSLFGSILVFFILLISKVFSTNPKHNIFEIVINLLVYVFSIGLQIFSVFNYKFLVKSKIRRNKKAEYIYIIIQSVIFAILLTLVEVFINEGNIGNIF